MSTNKASNTKYKTQNTNTMKTKISIAGICALIILGLTGCGGPKAKIKEALEKGLPTFIKVDDIKIIDTQTEKTYGGNSADTATFKAVLKARENTYALDATEFDYRKDDNSNVLFLKLMKKSGESVEVAGRSMIDLSQKEIHANVSLDNFQADTVFGKPLSAFGQQTTIVRGTKAETDFNDGRQKMLAEATNLLKGKLWRLEDAHTKGDVCYADDGVYYFQYGNDGFESGIWKIDGDTLLSKDSKKAYAPFGKPVDLPVFGFKILSAKPNRIILWNNIEKIRRSLTLIKSADDVKKENDAIDAALKANLPGRWMSDRIDIVFYKTGIARITNVLGSDMFGTFANMEYYFWNAKSGILSLLEKDDSKKPEDRELFKHKVFSIDDKTLKTRMFSNGNEYIMELKRAVDTAQREKINQKKAARLAGVWYVLGNHRRVTFSPDGSVLVERDVEGTQPANMVCHGAWAVNDDVLYIAVSDMTSSDKDKIWSQQYQIKNADEDNYELVRLFQGSTSPFLPCAAERKMDSPNAKYLFTSVGVKTAAESVEWCRSLAEKGNAQAQWLLGLMYESGAGVPENRAEAINWYRKAAEQKNKYGLEAMERLK